LISFALLNGAAFHLSDKPYADPELIGKDKVLLGCFAFTFLNAHVYLDTMILLGSLSTRYSEVVRWAFAGRACLASATWFSSLGYRARLLLPVFRNPRSWRVLDASMAVFMLILCMLLLLRPLD
jgi:L-lysine exporter family protein LysE/ArgO